VLFLGVFAQSKEKDIIKFAKKYQLTYPVGKENGIAEILGAKGIPETFFITRDGRIAKQHTDPINYKVLSESIEEILK
jgi:cytochrome c biogenesis protein CcmG/thiol:disulfide interchange protein DsbE